MSFEFRISNVEVDPVLFSTVGADYRAIRRPGVEAWLGWRGATTRGVTLLRDQGDASIVLRNFSSRDDVALAIELCARLTPRGGKVEVEDLPPGAKGNSHEVTVKDLERWPKDWFAYQSFSSVNRFSTLTGSQCLTLSTPGRFALLTPTLLKTLGYQQATGRFSSELHRGPTITPPVLKQDSELAATQPIVEYLQWAMPFLRLPSRPRFLSTELPPPGSCACPSSFDLVGEPLASGEANLLQPLARPSHTTLVPDEEALVIRADFVSFERKGAWEFIRFDDFLSELGEVKWLDEHTLIFPSIGGEDWRRFIERLHRHQRGKLETSEFLRPSARQVLLMTTPELHHTPAELQQLRASELARNEGRLGDALRHLTRAIELGPDRSDGWYWRSRVRLSLERTKLALEDMRQASMKEHVNPQFGAGIDGDLAEQLMNVGDE